MSKNNAEVREALKKNNVKAWELADILGMRPEALSVQMRRELPESTKELYISMIGKLAAEQEAKDD